MTPSTRSTAAPIMWLPILIAAALPAVAQAPAAEPSPASEPAPAVAPAEQAAPAPASETAPAAEPLPAGEELLDRYVEATGGREAYEQLTSRVTRGTIEFVGAGISAEITVYEARPARQYSIFDSEATGPIEQGSDGEVVWELTALTGPAVKEGPERAAGLRGAAFDRVENWRRLYDRVETVGHEELDGEPVYRVELTPAQGEPETHYYHRDSGLLIRAEQELETQMGVLPVVTHFSDYRPVDGVLLPHRTRLVVAIQEVLVTVASVEHNTEIPEERFALPDEIRELVEQAAGRDDEPEPPS